MGIGMIVGESATINMETDTATKDPHIDIIISAISSDDVDNISESVLIEY